MLALIFFLKNRHIPIPVFFYTKKLFCQMEVLIGLKRKEPVLHSFAWQAIMYIMKLFLFIKNSMSVISWILLLSSLLNSIVFKVLCFIYILILFTP